VQVDTSNPRVLVGEFVTAFVAGAYEMFLRLPKRYPQLRSLNIARRAFVTPRTPFTLLFAVDDTTFSTSPHQFAIERDELSPTRRTPRYHVRHARVRILPLDELSLGRRTPRYRVRQARDRILPLDELSPTRRTPRYRVRQARVRILPLDELSLGRRSPRYRVRHARVRILPLDAFSRIRCRSHYQLRLPGFLIQTPAPLLILGL